MSALELFTWWCLAVAGVLGCGLFAGLETGVYSLNRVRLYVLAHVPRSRAGQLALLIAQPAGLLASLLIATNVATNVATGAVAVIMHERGLSEWQVVAFDVLIMTPVFFIFAETLPKDLFAAHADHLVYRFAGLLRLLTGFFRAIGLLSLITGMSHLVVRCLGGPRDLQPFGPRHLVGSLMKEGVGRGLLSDDQSAMVERVLALGGHRVGQVMRPWRRVKSIGVDDPASRLWVLADQSSYSRFPVVDQAGRVVGVVDVNDALVHDPSECPPPSALMAPTRTLDADTPLRAALSALQTGLPFAVVERGGRPIGFVTLKDLIETITGELASW